ncbi:hypothetical protein [Glaciecola sp. 1036]|uniref:hypothetical protein n=1 Tax=Alteromonadaceae TaxID=72275 RepID=UPI003D06DBBE
MKFLSVLFLTGILFTSYTAKSALVTYNFEGYASFGYAGNSTTEGYVVRNWFGAEPIDPSRPVTSPASIKFALTVDDQNSPNSYTSSNGAIVAEYAQYTLESLTFWLGTQSWSQTQGVQMTVLNGIAEDPGYNTHDRISFFSQEDSFLGLNRNLSMLSSYFVGQADENTFSMSDTSALAFFNDLHDPNNERNSPTGTLRYLWEDPTTPGFQYVGEINLGNIQLTAVETANVSAPTTFLMLSSMLLIGGLAQKQRKK